MKTAILATALAVALSYFGLIAFGQALGRAVDEVRNSVPQRIAAQMAHVEATVPS